MLVETISGAVVIFVVCIFELFLLFLDSNEALWCCAWSGNGKLLASAGSDRQIRLYQHGNTWALSAKLSTGHQKSIRNLSFAPRRPNQLAAASFDGTVSIWSGKGEWTCTATVEGHENEVKAAVWASFIDEVEGEEQRFLATCGRDKTVWVWAVEESLHDPNDEDYECLAVLQEHEQDIKCLTWHPRIPLFLTGSYDESVRVWGPTGPSLDDWVPLGELLKNAGGTVWSLAFDAQGGKLAVALSTGILILFTLPKEDGWKSFRDWKREDFKIFEAVQVNSTNDSNRCCNDDEEEEPTGCCNNVQEESTGATGCCNNEEQEESTGATGANGCCNNENEKSSIEEGCCGSSNAAAAASGCCSRPKQALAKPTIPAAELVSASWSPDSRFVVLASSDHSITVFDAVEGRRVHEIRAAHEEAINCVAWNPQSNVSFASCSDDGTLKVWKLN
jgi:WD40 repeat protein